MGFVLSNFVHPCTLRAFPCFFWVLHCLGPMLPLIFRKFYGQFASANNGESCMTKDHQLPPQYPRVAPSWKYLAKSFQLANQKVLNELSKRYVKVAPSASSPKKPRLINYTPRDHYYMMITWRACLSSPDRVKLKRKVHSAKEVCLAWRNIALHGAWVRQIIRCHGFSSCWGLKQRKTWNNWIYPEGAKLS